GGSYGDLEERFVWGTRPAAAGKARCRGRWRIRAEHREGTEGLVDQERSHSGWYSRSRYVYDDGSLRASAAQAGNARRYGQEAAGKIVHRRRWTIRLGYREGGARVSAEERPRRRRDGRSSDARAHEAFQGDHPRHGEGIAGTGLLDSGFGGRG